jgi:hypothetical protein
VSAGADPAPPAGLVQGDGRGAGSPAEGDVRGGPAGRQGMAAPLLAHPQDAGSNPATRPAPRESGRTGPPATGSRPWPGPSPPEDVQPSSGFALLAPSRYSGGTSLEPRPRDWVNATTSGSSTQEGKDRGKTTLRNLLFLLGSTSGAYQLFSQVSEPLRSALGNGEPFVGG